MNLDYDDFHLYLVPLLACFLLLVCIIVTSCLAEYFSKHGCEQEAVSHLNLPGQYSEYTTLDTMSRMKSPRVNQENPRERRNVCMEQQKHLVKLVLDRRERKNVKCLYDTSWFIDAMIA